MPIVSVIVPIYAVEEYLPACIGTLAAQTLSDFECVLVDDSSPDGSAEIARRAQAVDPRFKYVHQPNRGPGPGGGRNGGLATASGRYIIFFDADDVIEPNALADMVALAEGANLDLVTCNADRLIAGAYRYSEFHDLSHPFDMESTTAANSPWLMYDATPWNKLFRRAFFDRVVGEWPERVLYEDIVAMTTAHLLSERTGVIAQPLYHWRIRSDGSSITQDDYSIKGDIAQIGELRRGLDAVQAYGTDELATWFGWKALCFDLHWMTRKLAAVPAELATELRHHMRELIAVLPSAARYALPARSRRAYEWLEHGSQYTISRKVRIVGGRLSAINRSLDRARDTIDPEATVTRIGSTAETMEFDIAIGLNRAPRSGWELGFAARSLLGPGTPKVAAQAPGSPGIGPARNSQRFAIELSDLAGLAHGSVAHLAVYNGEHIGEIGRGFQDKVRGQISFDRSATVGEVTIVPFMDNDRLLLSIAHREDSLVTIGFDGRLVFELGARLAERTCSLTLSSPLIDHELHLDRVDDCRWASDPAATKEALERDTVLFLAGADHVNPHLPVPILGTQSIGKIGRRRVGELSLEVVLANYGQVAIRSGEVQSRAVAGMWRQMKDSGLLTRKKQ